MNPKVAHILTGLGLIASAILAIADKITPLTAVNPYLANAWPFVTIGSLLIVSINKQFLPSSGGSETKKDK